MTMPAAYYRAESENGDGIDDPSEDALFMVFGALNHTDNTFVVIKPDTEHPLWSASVSLLDEGGYEVELRDLRRSEHELTVEHDLGRIAQEVTIWLAARFAARSLADIEPDSRKVRAWAAQAGIPLSNRGHIPTDVIWAYQRAHGIEPILPEQGRRLPLLPGYRGLGSLLVRTDFSDDEAWCEIIAAIGQPTRDGFVASVDVCDDREFADLPTAQLIEHLPNGTNGRRHRIFFVVDARTVQDSEHPLIVVDAREEPGREFRLIPSAVQVVGDNMNIGNTWFRDFTYRVDPDGVFRHY